MSKRTRPITPEQVAKKRKNSIPGEVFQVFNLLISESWDGRESVVLQKDAVKRIREILNITSTIIFDNGWMDVEDHYRGAGWKVDYDKPGYNETYDAFYTFRK